jgi:hypothetical protein
MVRLVNWRDWKFPSKRGKWGVLDDYVWIISPRRIVQTVRCRPLVGFPLTLFPQDGVAATNLER